MKKVALTLMLLLAACTQKASQDVYKSKEVGVSMAIEYGTVTSTREVTIAADNKSYGALGGAAAGAGGGSYVGDGSGSAWAAVGGAVAGAVIGNVIEEEISKSTGYEYTIEMRNGDTKMIVMPKIEGEKMFKPGDKVMLQSCDAGEHFKKCYPEIKSRQYQRLLPVSKFPPETKNKTKKKKIIEVEVDGVDPNNVDAKGQ